MENSLPNDVVSKSSSTAQTKISNLSQMVQEDELLLDFFRHVKEHNLRNEAYALLEKRLGE